MGELTTCDRCGHPLHHYDNCADFDRLQEIRALVLGYSWLADGRGPYQYDDDGYDADVRMFVQNLRKRIADVHHIEPRQTVYHRLFTAEERIKPLAGLPNVAALPELIAAITDLDRDLRPGPSYQVKLADGSLVDIPTLDEVLRFWAAWDALTATRDEAVEG